MVTKYFFTHSGTFIFMLVIFCPTRKGVGMVKQDKWLMQSRLVPELNALLQKRYRLLQMIEAAEPIGRRALADMLKMTERTVRNETTILKQEGLIEIHQTGMICTDEGKEIIEGLREFVYNVSGLDEKERRLAEQLGIRKVMIAENVSVDVEMQMNLIGKLAAEKLMTLVNENNVIAVTGGSSVAALVPYLLPVPAFKGVQVVAARGGLGQTLSTQANVIASQFSQQSGAVPKMLFVPENLSKESYDAIREEPVIKEVTSLYNEVDIVIHGLGEAIEMARRRNAKQELIDELKEKGAVGEAFGYYFNADGEIVHQIASIGIQLEQVKKANYVIAVAAGKSKVNAIQAYLKNGMPQTILITDEQTADAILK